MKHLSLFLILLLAVAVAAEAGANSVPPLINYQGTLTDAQGQPVANTSKKLTFNIYDAVADGSLIWGPQVFDSVPVINGMFNIILGTTDTQGRLISEAFDSNPRFLGITVDEVGQSGGAEIAPRQQILSTAFAFRAEHALTSDNAAHAVAADSALKAETVEGEYVYVDPDNGRVGIGTTSPKHRLDVVGTAKISGGVKPDYDSGWYHEDSTTSHVVTKTHNLGVYPSRIQILFSEDDPPSGYIFPVPLMTHGQSGGPESLKFDSTELVYSIYVGDHIAYWWDNAGTAKSYRSGYYRILLWK